MKRTHMVESMRRIMEGVALVGVLVVGLTAAAAASPPAAMPGEQAAMPKGVIGVSLHVGAERVGDPAVLYVAHVHPEGPAHKSGLAHGDEISAVDGTSVAGKTYEQVVMMIRGDAGSVVKLTVKGDGGSREVSITRVPGDSLYKAGMGSHEGPGR